MKSILALLVLVAVANAGIIKSGGLKGSWSDEIVVISATPDETAPGIDYDGTTQAINEVFSEFPGFDTNYFANVSSQLYDGDYSTITFSFAFTGEVDGSDSSWFNLDYNGGYEVTFWSGTVDDMHTLRTECDLYYYDNTVSCSIRIRNHLYAGVYAPLITVWDLNGNWASYDATAFAVVGDQATFEIASNDPDVMAPRLTGEAISDAAIILGVDTVIQNNDVGGQTIIEVMVNDGDSQYQTGGSDADSLVDENGSGLYAVWATLSTGVVDTEGFMTEDIALFQQEWVATTGDYRYSVSLSFANFAEPAVWDIQVWAIDYAGNVGLAATSLTLTVTFDDTALSAAGGVFSCQSLDLYVNDVINYDNEVTVTATDYDTVYFLGECTEKDEASNNYVAIAFTSDEYAADGVTDPVTMTLWNAQANGFGQGVSWTTCDEDTYPSWSTPGDEVTTGAFGLSDYLLVPSALPQVSFWLSEVDTVTTTGGIQRYNLADGAASSVVPSIFAVAVAAAVALFRL